MGGWVWSWAARCDRAVSSGAANLGRIKWAAGYGAGQLGATGQFRVELEDLGRVTELGSANWAENRMRPNYARIRQEVFKGGRMLWASELLPGFFWTESSTRLELLLVSGIGAKRIKTG
ncbi:unnamed protein product [Prunus armeniaca]|uniref:Uncharacterized protein n=1 Tax=Prunus armeniaca TaxID=36596 RepID=A0A6J5USD7_PRUAR|nr:unnamed protein product [Prunus armeniaca]CAB4309114.1 unnamed protein product [Prunus armeniaca]